MLTNKRKASWILFFLCASAYITVWIAKTALAASMVGIVSEGFFTKSQLGIVNGSYFIFYGGGQLLGGRITDKISPYKMIVIAICGAILSLFGIAISRNFTFMLIIWSIGGLLEFGIWPSTMRIISQYILPEHKSKAMFYIGFASCVGTIFSYLCASIILDRYSWRILFLVYMIILTCMLCVWIIWARKTLIVLKNGELSEHKEKNETNEDDTSDFNFGKLFVVSGLFILLLPTFIRQTLSALNTWVPTMIKEVYGIASGAASILNIILSVVNLGGVLLVNFLYPKRIRNIIVVYFLCFVSMIPFTLMLMFTGKISVFIVLILLCGVTTMAYSASQCVNVVIPTYFAKYNCTGRVAAMINALGSFGSVAANIGFGFLSDNIGWTGTIISWSILALVGSIFTLITIPVWKRFSEK